MTLAEDRLTALRASVPDEVRQVCHVLTDAGHQAVTVGGAVRDALLGRGAGDWDVATSAVPDEVVKLFPRTIPTGIQHGTVTVMVGRGERRIGVEVTTFRGEGAYHDGRRPESVTFGVPLDEDLARRDLVVNAIAYDPIRDLLHDPFGGQADIAARRLRAVGDPVARFTEDGLRILRAVRFAATLEFELDAETEAGFAPALGSLRKVSQERVRVELWKLLGARAPGAALEVARRSAVLEVVLPEIAALAAERWAALTAWVDRAPAQDPPAVRLAALLSPVSERADAILRRLKASNEERDRVVRLARAAMTPPQGAPALRRVLASATRALGPDVIALWASRGDAEELAALAGEILGRGDALVTGDLALGGADLMKELGLPPGRAIGELLAGLTQWVLDDPARNTREALLSEARTRSAAATS